MTKKFFDLIAKILFTIAALFALALGITTVLPEAVAQVRNIYPTPALFEDYTGTNWVGFNASAGLEVRKGGTIYTGGTTNIALTNAFKLKFVNGVFAGAVPFTD